jgi:hypothetical protein
VNDNNPFNRIENIGRTLFPEIDSTHKLNVEGYVGYLYDNQEYHHVLEHGVLYFKSSMKYLLPTSYYDSSTDSVAVSDDMYYAVTIRAFRSVIEFGIFNWDVIGEEEKAWISSASANVRSKYPLALEGLYFRQLLAKEEHSHKYLAQLLDEKELPAEASGIRKLSVLVTCDKYSVEYLSRYRELSTIPVSTAFDKTKISQGVPFALPYWMSEEYANMYTHKEFELLIKSVLDGVAREYFKFLVKLEDTVMTLLRGNCPDVRQSLPGNIVTKAVITATESHWTLMLSEKEVKKVPHLERLFGAIRAELNNVYGSVFSHE